MLLHCDLSTSRWSNQRDVKSSKVLSKAKVFKQQPHHITRLIFAAREVAHLSALQHTADQQTFHYPVTVPIVKLSKTLPWDEEVAAHGELCAQMTGIASTL